MVKANSLVAIIKERQAQIAQLQKELDDVKALLLGEAVARTDAPRILAIPPIRHTKRSGAKRHRRKRPSSSVTMTEAVLKEASGTLHINEILKRIEDRFHKKVLKTTLVGNLARKVKDGNTFYRPAPSTFGLLEDRK